MNSLPYKICIRVLEKNAGMSWLRCLTIIKARSAKMILPKMSWDDATVSRMGRQLLTLGRFRTKYKNIWESNLWYEWFYGKEAVHIFKYTCYVAHYSNMPVFWFHFKSNDYVINLFLWLLNRNLTTFIYIAWTFMKT